MPVTRQMKSYYKLRVQQETVNEWRNWIKCFLVFIFDYKRRRPACAQSNCIFYLFISRLTRSDCDLPQWHQMNFNLLTSFESQFTKHDHRVEVVQPVEIEARALVWISEQLRSITIQGWRSRKVSTFKKSFACSLHQILFHEVLESFNWFEYSMTHLRLQRLPLSLNYVSECLSCSGVVT